jgi:hypothetical protein
VTEGISRGEFSVYWWSALDSQHYEECRLVSPDAALRAFKRLTMGPASVVAARVIVTDAGDCIAAEWVKGKGLTFPMKEELEAS